jgi:hypothetical protein
MATSEVTRELPAVVAINLEQAGRITPNQMRMIRAVTGKTMSEIFGEDAAEEDRLQAMIWLELRKQGFDPSWDQAGDVGLEAVTDQADPTTTANSTGSPLFAASGA